MHSLLEIDQLRNKFPELSRKIRDKTLIYFDNAASTFKPKNVIDAVTAHYTFNAANIHRGVHYLSENGTLEYEKTRQKVKVFINSEFLEEIIFTKGTTDSINLLADTLGRTVLSKDAEILLSTMEHHSNIVPWQMMAERYGAKIIEIPIDDNGDIKMEEYRKLLSSRTCIVSVAHISNAIGTINPVKEMIKLAHEKDAIFVLDAAQSILHKPIDVQTLDCDFMAFSAHKMLGPTGVGVLYGKKALLEKLPPYQGGGDMIDKVSFEKTTYADIPFKFEAGTPNIAGVISFYEAIDFVQSLDWDKLMAYEQDLLAYATDKLEKIPQVRIIGTAKNKSSVLSFVVKDSHPQDLGTLLDQQGIAVRTGHHCAQPLMNYFRVPGTIRASFCFYNTKAEIDFFVRALVKSINLL